MMHIRNNAALIVKYYIDSNYNTSITLTHLARLVFISKQYLIKLFKDLTGYTPMRYISLLRIQLACNMLLDRSNPLNHICELTGFKDYHNLLYSFKKELGMTPTEFHDAYYNNAEEGIRRTRFVKMTKIIPSGYPLG